MVVPQASGLPVARPVARVNGAVLTDRDLAREIQTIFPYAQTHNGVPKSMEPEVRKGALDMIIFEELVYQEALRRKMTISPERMRKSETMFRKQFATEQEFNQVLQIEVHGSRQLRREHTTAPIRKNSSIRRCSRSRRFRSFLRRMPTQRFRKRRASMPMTR